MTTGLAPAAGPAKEVKAARASCWSMREPITLIYVGVFALFVYFVIWYVGQERYIYYWDHDLFYAKYRGFARALQTDAVAASRLFVASLRHSDYNLLGVLWLMPASVLLGTERLGYILAITITFALPAIVLFSRWLDTLQEGPSFQSGRRDVGYALIPLITIATTPQFWKPVLSGYIDVAGLIVAFSILIIYFRRQPGAGPLSALIAIGALLSTLVLLRRWYAYWAVGFMVAAGVRSILAASREQSGWRTCLLLLREPAIIGLTAVTMFCVVATPLAGRMISTDYADIYSAWNSTASWPERLAGLYRPFGVALFTAAMLGMVVLAVQRTTRVTMWLLMLQAGVTFVLFARTADFGDQQHWYPVVITVVTCAAAFARHVYVELATRVQKTMFISAWGMLGMCNLLLVFDPSSAARLAGLTPVLAQARQYPLVRQDLAELDRLLSALDGLTRHADSAVYVLASGHALNDAILKNACERLPPHSRDLAGRIITAHHVDKRDGFPRRFFRAEFVVVSDPIMYHLRPEDQRVIGTLAQLILDGSGIGNAYERLPMSFELHSYATTFPVTRGRARVYIYQKQRPLQASQVRDLLNVFANAYPDRPHLHPAPESVLSYLREVPRVQVER